MTSSTYDTITNAVTTGTIIAIVVGSVIGLVILIATIIIIICIIKHLNRSKTATRQAMMLQPVQPYTYPHSWSNQYPPNTMSVSNYPPAYQPTAPPYTASTQIDTKPTDT